MGNNKSSKGDGSVNTFGRRTHQDPEPSDPDKTKTGDEDQDKKKDDKPAPPVGGCVR